MQINFVLLIRTLSDLQHTTDWDREQLANSFNWTNNSGAIDVKMDGPILEEKQFFIKKLELSFFFKFHWGFYIVSTAKTASKKIGALIHSMNFLSPNMDYSNNFFRSGSKDT